jgi:4-aminobutyrate aminotransferase
MISEKELEKLSYTDAPKIVTDKVPGPKGQKIWDEAAKYETPTRVGGMYLPFVWNEALGTTVKDPDGNIFLDMTGGLEPITQGHTHPKVVKPLRDSQKN